MRPNRGFKLFYFLFYAAFSGFVMFRNVYFEEIGLTGTQMGAIGFLIPVCTMLAQPVWGLVADWKGLEKSILYVSAIVTGVAALAYPAVPTLPRAFLLILTITVVFASFRAPAVPIANALVLSTGMSYEGVRAYGSIAFGLAGVTIGYLIGVLGTGLIFPAYALGMGLIVLLLWDLPVADPVALASDLSLETIRPLLNRQFVLLLGAAFAIGVMTPPGTAFFSVYVRAVGHSDAITGVAWLLKTVAEAAAFLYIARSRRGAYRQLLAVGGLLYTATYLVLWLTGAIVPIMLAQLLLGAGFALFNLAAVNLAHALAPDALKSTAQSLLMVGGSSAGVAVGELLAGRLLDVVGAQQMYAVVALLGLVAAGVALRLTATGAATGPSSRPQG